MCPTNLSLLESRHDRTCGWCGASLAAARRDARFCGKRCRQSSWRFGGEPLARASGRPMRFAYADPPYPGMSARFYSDHPDYAGEIDHADLIARLSREYPDGWALSTSSKTLQYVLSLCPPGVRIGAWTKPMPPIGGRRATCAWEPVVLAGGRPRATEDGAILDWVNAAPMRAYPGAVTGTKPPAFSAWLFSMLNARRDDELDDLFPGSGAVQEAWRRAQLQDRSAGVGRRVAPRGTT